MWIQPKKVSKILTLLFLLSIIIPFEKAVDAYGVINHEKVVDAGKYHYVVLKDDGSVWSWGENSQSQLGAGIYSPYSSVPITIKKSDGNRLLNIKAIAAGGYHTVALDENGSVWTWGLNSSGQLGQMISSPYNNPNPTIVGDLPKKIVAIAAGDNHTLAVTEDGDVYAWGRNEYGQLGTNTPSVSSSIPVKVNVLSDIVAVAAGSNHSVALKRDGTVWTWGRNTTGQLGNGETTDLNFIPRMVPGLTNIVEIAAGDNHTLALKQDRTTIWAWGSNSYGQLGDGGKENKLYPIQVQGIQKVTHIAAGDNHTIALKEDGTVWAWGRNTSGVGTSRSTPIQIKGVSSVSAIGGGGGFDSFILAIRQDGTVWSWNSTSSDPTTMEPVFNKVHGIDNVMQLTQFPFVQGGQVLFRYFGDSSTHSVKVNGNFNDWVDLPLVHIGNNIWELQVELRPGEYNYGFIVNGKWMPDPLNRNKSVDEFGNPLSVLKVAPYATASPIINGKNVTFTYSSFDYNGVLELSANTDYVAVIGSFSNWQEIPLERQPNNTWAVTQTLEPGDYYYSYVVRDSGTKGLAIKRNDPLNPNLESNSVTGISRNKFHISELLPNTVPVTSVTLNKGPLLDLVVGEQTHVVETVSPTNASNKNVNWTSSNPSIVNVDENGKLTAIAKGTAVIICTTVDGGKTAMITVTVNDQDGVISYPRVGYKDYGAPTGVIQNKVWKVKFNQPIDRNSLVQDNIYILNQSGIKVPLAYLLQKDEKTLEIRLADGFRYSAGATYYLFIEENVKTKYGAKLSEPVQMKFTIKL